MHPITFLMPKAMRILVSLSLALILVVGIVWFVSTRSSTLNDQQTASGKVSVVASFYPLAEFARNVGGTHVDIETITPAGTEPHDYEPSTSEIASAYNANLFLMNGLGVDAWAEHIQSDVEKKGVAVINMGRVVAGSVTNNDPHFWLDPVIVAQEITAIRDALLKLDPANANVYSTNTDVYLAKLGVLDREFQSGLKTCAVRNIVTSHDAFAYLAHEYNFTVTAITGLSPAEEPSAGRMAEIADQAKKDGVKYIYFETLVNPKLAQTIADEIGAETLVFNPLEGLTTDELVAGENYFTIMEENLTNLEIGMECK